MGGGRLEGFAPVVVLVLERLQLGIHEIYRGEQAVGAAGVYQEWTEQDIGDTGFGWAAIKGDCVNAGHRIALQGDQFQ